MSSNTSAATPRPTKSRTRCTWSTEERLEWLSLLEQSGQTIAEFCRTHDLSKSTVALWRKQLRSAPTPSDDAGALIEVPMTAASDRTEPGHSTNVTAVVIRLSSDIKLDVIAGTDVAWLGELIHTLRSV